VKKSGPTKSGELAMRRAGKRESDGTLVASMTGTLTNGSVSVKGKGGDASVSAARIATNPTARPWERHRSILIGRCALCVGLCFSD
jgi:hypothetical protein